MINSRIQNSCLIFFSKNKEYLLQKKKEKRKTDNPNSYVTWFTIQSFCSLFSNIAKFCPWTRLPRPRGDYRMMRKSLILFIFCACILLTTTCMDMCVKFVQLRTGKWSKSTNKKNCSMDFKREFNCKSIVFSVYDHWRNCV